MNKFCNKCGAEISADSKFCSNCGSKIDLEGVDESRAYKKLLHEVNNDIENHKKLEAIIKEKGLLLKNTLTFNVQTNYNTVTDYTRSTVIRLMHLEKLNKRSRFSENDMLFIKKIILNEMYMCALKKDNVITEITNDSLKKLMRDYNLNVEEYLKCLIYLNLVTENNLMEVREFIQLNIDTNKDLLKTTKPRTNKKAGIVSCPKCGSTSITTTNKKISAGKGVAGGVVGNIVMPGVGTVVGAAVGATSSKKIYNVCMNCGHRW